MRNNKSSLSGLMDKSAYPHHNVQEATDQKPDYRYLGPFDVIVARTLVYICTRITVAHRNKNNEHKAPNNYTEEVRIRLFGARNTAEKE